MAAEEPWRNPIDRACRGDEPTRRTRCRAGPVRQGPGARARIEALKVLFTANFPQKQPDHPALQSGVLALEEAAAAGNERLEAVAALGRLMRGVKPLVRPISKSLQAAFTEPLPALTSWADAEDRRFVALAVATVNPGWALSYAADFLMRDDGSPRAREAFSELLVRSSGSAQIALETLVGEASRRGRLPFEVSVRLLRQTLAGLRTALSLEIPVGPEAPSRLADLVTAALPRIDAAQSRELRVEAAGDVLAFLLVLLNGSVSASFEPDAYRVVRSLRTWFAPARWPDELRPKLALVVERLVEAIETLALRRTPDDELFRTLDAIVGREEALEKTRAVLRRRPGTAPDVQAWLQSGPGAVSTGRSEAAAEASLRQADPAIAKTLMSARALQADAAALLDQAGQRADPALRSRLARLIHEVVQAARQAAASRGLKLVGSAGDIAAFDPTLHRMFSPSARAKNVRLLQPAVVREVGNAPPAVVQLATVEPFEGELGGDGSENRGLAH